MKKHEEIAADSVIQSQVHTIHHTQGLVTALLEQLYDMTNENTYLAGLEDMANRGDEAIERLLEAKNIGKPHIQQQQEQQHNNMANPALCPDTPRACAVDALKPFLLTEQHTLEDLQGWKAQFDTYYSNSHLDTLPYKDQVGYLRACIDKELFQDLADCINQATSIMEEGGAVQILDEEFRHQYPLFSWQHKYFGAEQPQGMKVTAWFTQLNRMGNEASLENLIVDQLKVFCFVTSVKDPDLQYKFLHLKEPTTDVMRLAFDQESIQHQMKVMSSSAAEAAISKAKQKKHMPTSNKTVSCKDLEGKCFRCGNANHKTKECPRKNVTCHVCGKQGHITPVCLSKGNQRQ